MPVLLVSSKHVYKLVVHGSQSMAHESVSTQQQNLTLILRKALPHTSMEAFPHTDGGNPIVGQEHSHTHNDENIATHEPLTKAFPHTPMKAFPHIDESIPTH